MKRLFALSFLMTFILLGLSSFSLAGVSPGDTAPDFELKDPEGNTHGLSDYDDKIIVLEWFNFGCPFVKKHYKSDNMQSLQKHYTEKDVIWLTVASSAPGKQGYLTPETAKTQPLLENAEHSALLLDSKGTVGKLYGAQTTPHMFIIDKNKVVYNGAIDDIRSTDLDDVPKATNYVKQALDELLAGKPVSVKTTKPYGCSVKY